MAAIVAELAVPAATAVFGVVPGVGTQPVPAESGTTCWYVIVYCVTALPPVSSGGLHVTRTDPLPAGATVRSLGVPGRLTALGVPVPVDAAELPLAFTA